jgi:hypothetical protein
VEGNPISRTDPTGNYWWGPGQALWNTSSLRYQSQNIHIRIQAMAMLGQEQIIHAEYPIPPMGMKVDLLDSMTGEVWEIKPWADSEQAVLELDARITNLEMAKENMLLKGMNPVAMPYDWNVTPSFWIEGFSFSNEVYVGTDDTGWYQIWAGQISPGVIVWWKYMNLRPEMVAIPLLLPAAMKYSQRNVRPGWVPSNPLNTNPVQSLQSSFSSRLDLEKTIKGIIPVVALYVIYKALETYACPILPFITP